ncbi:hypothetical protein LTR74_012075 [Friedmanniomyces endolithicus]|nr:hypothetical protein LTR74_012075 [Friedmanniomyces endolithicus]
MGSTPEHTRSRHHFAPLGSKGSGQHLDGGDNMQLKGIVFDMVIPSPLHPHSGLTNGGQEGEPQNYMFGQMRQAVGIPKEIDILDHIHSLSSSQQEEAFAKIQAIEQDAMAKQVPQPGLVTLMEYLDERGILKAICTRNFERVFTISRVTNTAS